MIAFGYKLKPIRNGKGYKPVIVATKEEALAEQKRLNEKTGKYWAIFVNII